MLLRTQSIVEQLTAHRDVVATVAAAGASGPEGTAGAQRITAVVDDLHQLRSDVDGARARSGPIHDALRAVQKFQVHAANALPLEDAGAHAHTKLTHAIDAYTTPAALTDPSTTITPELAPSDSLADLLRRLEANSAQVARNNAWFS